MWSWFWEKLSNKVADTTWFEYFIVSYAVHLRAEELLCYKSAFWSHVMQPRMQTLVSTVENYSHAHRAGKNNLIKFIFHPSLISVPLLLIQYVWIWKWPVNQTFFEAVCIRIMNNFTGASNIMDWDLYFSCWKQWFMSCYWWICL